MTKQTSVPKLRFPEFSGNWEEISLEKVISYTKGYAFKSEFYDTDGVRIVRVSDLSANAIKIDNEKIFINLKRSEGLNKYVLNKGDIIITTVGSKAELLESAVGRPILIRTDNEGLLNQNLLKFNKSDKVKNEFIFGYLNLKEYTEYIAIIQRGNANQSNITVSDLLNFKVSIPPLPEQTKIANFLTAIDEKIQGLKEKKSLLEDYKKGLMQQIFSQKLRFKQDDGSDFPDWEEKTLGEVADVRDGTHDSPNYVIKGFPFITSKNLLTNGKMDFVNVNYISEQDFIKINKRSGVNIGDILFGMIGTIGNPVMVVRDGFAIKNVALIKETEKLYNSFLIHFLNSKLIKKQFYQENKGGTQKFLSLSVIRDLKIQLPSSSEQILIGNSLSSIDEKIEKVSQQIAEVESYKKGLLQQMFV